MKKAFLLGALCTLALVLTACASSNDPGGATASGGNSFRSGASRALAPEAKLALGTIKLEGTPQAVDAQTAAKLIPLWQLMVQLQSSSSTAPQEVTAVMDQIQATMSRAQLNTINGMTFTSEDVFSLLQSQAQASNGSSGTRGSGGNGFSGRNRGGGGFFFAGPGGAPGGGFGGGFGGGGVRNGNAGANGSGNSTQLTPAEQAQAAQARENGISTLVEGQLIRLLETKVNRQPG